MKEREKRLTKKKFYERREFHVHQVAQLSFTPLPPYNFLNKRKRSFMEIFCLIGNKTSDKFIVHWR